MDLIFQAWGRGETPGQHLWGITHLSAYGIQVDILPHKRNSALNKIGKILRIADFLDQQVRVLLNYSRYDLVYSACQDNTLLLSILRYIGVFRKPIIAIVHHPIPKSRRTNIYVKGHDKLVCLSRTVRQDLEDKFGIGGERACVLDWGVDLPFYDKGNAASPTEPQNGFILSAGKTARDHDTLVRAFSEINYPLKIYCSGRSAPTLSHLPANVTVSYNHPTHNGIPNFDLLAEYNRAYAIAIPLIETHSLAGLTSLLDAMVMQKAVIMTRNRCIDLDIEKEGIGIWVDPGDVGGWRDAAAYLLAHPDKARQMGNRGYQLCASTYNLETFSAGLAKVILACPERCAK